MKTYINCCTFQKKNMTIYIHNTLVLLYIPWLELSFFFVNKPWLELTDWFAFRVITDRFIKTMTLLTSHFESHPLINVLSLHEVKSKHHQRKLEYNEIGLSII